jgi:hypothetical protein
MGGGGNATTQCLYTGSIATLLLRLKLFVSNQIAGLSIAFKMLHKQNQAVRYLLSQNMLQQNSMAQLVKSQYNQLVQILSLMQAPGMYLTENSISMFLN